MSETTSNKDDLAQFGLDAYRACVYLDKAVPVAGRDNVERIRFAADEIVALRAEVARLREALAIARKALLDSDGIYVGPFNNKIVQRATKKGSDNPDAGLTILNFGQWVVQEMDKTLANETTTAV